MKSINRQQLVDRMVALVRTGGAAQADDATLRQRIGDLVDNAAAHAPPADSRRVTILLSDLRGFTAIAERHTALEMVSALNRYFSRMTEIIMRWGGSIDKFMGDAIMVLFGAPQALANDIEAAIACAIEMQMAMDDINLENLRCGMAVWYMGIGINTGEVVAGHLGSRLHSEYTVIGDQVNLASRVEAHSLRGQILLSENTYLQARRFITTGDVNEVSVKGKRDNVRMYELLSTDRPHPLVAPKRETRHGPRVEVDMPLAFQVLHGKSVTAQEFTGRIVDISYGGMYVLSPAVLQPFDDIRIALSLSLMGRELTQIYAKVLRVSSVSGEYGYPVEFTSIEPKAQQSIKELVDSIVELERG